MTQTVELPTFRFVHGPASGTRPVLPDGVGELPRFVAVPEPVADYPYADPPEQGSPVTHLYERHEIAMPAGTVYQYVRSFPPYAMPRIFCPRCGRKSPHPDDVAAGYCGNCHATTRIPRYAVLRPADGYALPDYLDGEWTDRRGAQMRLTVAGQAWTATGTHRFERAENGAYAEVFEARPK